VESCQLKEGEPKVLEKRDWSIWMFRGKRNRPVCGEKRGDVPSQDPEAMISWDPQKARRGKRGGVKKTRFPYLKCRTTKTRGLCSYLMKTKVKIPFMSVLGPEKI